jgi:hypothetical protein
METSGSLVFYAAVMTGLSVIGWWTWSFVASRNGAHARETVSFFRREYESVFFSRDMLVALFKENFAGAEVLVKSGNGSGVIAGLRYLPKAADNNKILFETNGRTCPLNAGHSSASSLRALLEYGRYECEYSPAANRDGKSVFCINKSIVFETECGRNQLLVEGKYPVLQNGQIVGYIYSESNILGHYAVVLLLKSELPVSVKALFLALEARRFGFTVGGGGDR